MPNEFVQGYLIGQQIKQQRAAAEREAERLKYEKQRLDASLKLQDQQMEQVNLQKEMFARQLGMENLQFAMQQPRGVDTNRGMSNEPGTLPPPPGMAGAQLRPIEQKLLEMKRVNIPGVPSLGVEGQTVDPFAMRQFAQQQQEQAARRAAELEVGTAGAKKAVTAPYEIAIAEAGRRPVDRAPQLKQGVHQGKRIWASWDPDTQQFTDENGQILEGFTPLPGTEKSASTRTVVFEDGGKTYVAYPTVDQLSKMTGEPGEGDVERFKAMGIKVFQKPKTQTITDLLLEYDRIRREQQPQ